MDPSGVKSPKQRQRALQKNWWRGPEYQDGNRRLPDKPDKSVAELAGGELKFAQNYLRDFNLNLWLADGEPRYLITSPVAYVLAVADKSDPSRRLEITLDRSTFLPVRQRLISLADPSDPVPGKTQFDKWEVIGGVRFPQRISIFHGSKKVAVITVKKTKLNSGIRPHDLATKPIDLTPVM